MPRLDIDMFDEEPKVGDKVKVMGKVESIDEDSGEVEVSYDDVKIIDEKKRKRKSHRSTDDMEDETITLDMETEPNSQSLDQALARSFPNTQ